SVPLAGYGQVRKYCPKVGYCSSKCSKADVWSLSSDCKFYCCLPPGWKGK
ncbi:Cygnin, partial [Anas platyrhynchos]